MHGALTQPQHAHTIYILVPYNEYQLKVIYTCVLGSPVNICSSGVGMTWSACWTTAVLTGSNSSDWSNLIYTHGIVVKWMNFIKLKQLTLEHGIYCLHLSPLKIITQILVKLILWCSYVYLVGSRPVLSWGQAWLRDIANLSDWYYERYIHTAEFIQWLC